jgi:hypothetical protein
MFWPEHKALLWQFSTCCIGRVIITVLSLHQSYTGVSAFVRSQVAVLTEHVIDSASAPQIHGRACDRGQHFFRALTQRSNRVSRGEAERQHLLPKKVCIQNDSLL